MTQKADPQDSPESSNVSSEESNGADRAASEDASANSDAPKPAPDPLQEAQAEAARYKDQLLRTAADFDNFRKRTRRDLADAEKKGGEDLLRELLPVFDNLERAAGHAESATDVQSLAEGVTMVMRQFIDTLKRLGIERVAGVGNAFDPMVHEAIQHLETADFAPGSIANEVQGGYIRGDRLLRPALVVVAKPPTSTATAAEQSDAEQADDGGPEDDDNG